VGFTSTGFLPFFHRLDDGFFEPGDSNGGATLFKEFNAWTLMAGASAVFFLKTLFIVDLRLSA
jgi:hypothetical protein